MKKSIFVRVLAALGGLTLLALSAGMAAEAFFGVQITALAARVLASKSVPAVLATLVLILVLAVLAVAAVICAVPRRKKEQDGFVMQRGENGAIGISVKAIEKQVRACIAKHDVIAEADVAIRECREGLIILLNVDQVAGVNIPLSVGLLQKQIKQYVSSCTGVDVHEVRVMVENNTSNVVASPFAVQDAEIVQVRPVEEARPAADPIPAAQPATADLPAEAAAPAATPAPAAPAVVLPEIPPMPAVPETTVEDERPLHQRIFGAEEQPVFVPAPPELIAETQSEPEAAEAEATEQEAEGERELVIDADVNAAPEEVLPLEAAEAGALWLDGEEDAEAAPVQDSSAGEDAESFQPIQ